MGTRKEREERIDYKDKVSIDKQKFSIKSHMDYAEPNRKMRIYLFPKNEGVWENFEKRWNRPVATWNKIALQVLDKYGFTDCKISFSQKAGCTCGCSPGFIADVKNGRELFITYNQVKK